MGPAMKDELNELFRERFAGHETPVDPALWDTIQAQLGPLPTPGEAGLKDLLQKRFSGHEVPVDPSAWANISSQLGHGAAAGAAAGAGLGPLGWAAASIGVLAIAGITYLFWNQTTVAKTPRTVAVERPAPEPAVTTAAPFVANEAAPVPIITEPASGPHTEVPLPVMDQVPQAATPKRAGSMSDPHSPDEPAQVIAGDRTIVGDQPVVGDQEPQGARLVEHIITELTTRVTEEVLAEAAQRSTLGESITTVDQDQLVVEPTLALQTELPKLYLPNTFTPNGDGVNDTYTVLDADAFERIMLRVYDVRNDRLVFNTNTNEPWNGDGCMDGYYLVAVEAMTTTGQLVTQGKVVWLTRNAMH